MKPNNWAHIEQIVQGALERPRDTRAVFLDETCADDEALRAEVESLLQAHERSEGFMEKDISDAMTELLSSDNAGSATEGELIGTYKIVSTVGTGGMGEVYLAQDMRLGRKVALKILPADLSQDENRLRRFEREARLASSLTHPNICTIHEVNRTGDGRHFIVMEYVDGRTLRERLKEKQLGLREALDIAIQIAAALAAAHEAGILHRDIKPENIMLRPDGYVKVLDFGLAKLTETTGAGSSSVIPTHQFTATAANLVMGTVCYMSPEQARGLAVDARTDIFSLGVVVYEMIAGQRPFTGETMSDCLAAVLTGQPPPLALGSIQAPEELGDIVNRALQKDREQRYQTAEDIAAALKTVRHHLDRPSPVRRRPRAFPWMRGKGLVAITATAILAVLAVITFMHFGSAKGAIDSIAVLPFENENHDPDWEYLSDGVTESVINNLTQIQRLRVVPRTSVFRYKNKRGDPISAGRDLHVRAVLTGRILQRNDNIAVGAELIDVRNDKQLWGERYTRKIADALVVQQDISQEISYRLRLNLTGEQQKRLERQPTDNPDAYQLYLKGRYYWNKRADADLQKAVEFFQQAIDHDPRYAAAYVGMANCFILLSTMPANEGTKKSEALIARALELDDTLPEAHTAQAMNYQRQWRWRESEAEYRKAIQLNPNYPTAHHWYSTYLRDTGRFKESVAEAKRAEELDPLSPILYANLGYAYIANGEAAAAEREGEKGLEIEPNYSQLQIMLAQAYLKNGRVAQAMSEFDSAIKIDGRRADALTFVAYAYGVAGQNKEARTAIADLEQHVGTDVSGWNVAAGYAGIGDKDHAFQWLEKDFADRASELARIRWMLPFGPLRDDPRYDNLLRRMGQLP